MLFLSERGLRTTWAVHILFPPESTLSIHVSQLCVGFTELLLQRPILLTGQMGIRRVRLRLQFSTR